jgi:hypothetical protein
MMENVMKYDGNMISISDEIWWKMMDTQFLASLSQSFGDSWKWPGWKTTGIAGQLGNLNLQTDRSKNSWFLE